MYSQWYEIYYLKQSTSDSIGNLGFFIKIIKKINIRKMHTENSLLIFNKNNNWSNL